MKDCEAYTAVDSTPIQPGNNRPSANIKLLNQRKQAFIGKFPTEFTDMASMLGELVTTIRHQYSNLPLKVNTESCTGKTFIVTGANIGLGYEAAKHLVRLGSHRVILAVRSIRRCETALAAIESETGVRSVAEIWKLDLSSYESTLAFADRVEQELERVDAIIENATAANKDWTFCEGWESTIMVNIFGTLLLAVLLMPHLERCAKKYNMKPRIVIVTSGLAWTRQVDLANIDRSDILRDVNDSKKWSIDGTNRYAICHTYCGRAAQVVMNVQIPLTLTIDIPCRSYCRYLLAGNSHPSLQRHELAW